MLQLLSLDNHFSGVVNQSSADQVHLIEISFPLFGPQEAFCSSKQAKDTAPKSKKLRESLPPIRKAMEVGYTIR